MTAPLLRSLLALSLLTLAACSQTAKTPQAPPGQAPVLETMTDPGTGQPVIALSLIHISEPTRPY